MGSLCFEYINWVVSQYKGDDGVSLQGEEVTGVINNIGSRVNFIIGQEEDKSDGDYNGNRKIIIPELSLKHQDDLCRVFSPNAVDESVWREAFNQDLSRIGSGLNEILSGTNDPITGHNPLSYRHGNEALATALKKIMEQWPDRIFVSFAPDSSFERPEQIEELPNYRKIAISRNGGLEEGFDGPFLHPNLYHIVLTPKQKKLFMEQGVPENRIFVNPDISDFGRRHLEESEPPTSEFFDFLSDHCIAGFNGKPIYWKEDVNPDHNYVIGNVRPVYRKKLRFALLVAKTLERKTGKKTSFVNTHSYKHDPDYFGESVQFADDLDLQFIYLGDSLDFSKKNNPKKRSYSDFRSKVSYLKSICMVPSASGGFENAIPEAIKHKIPVYMNPELNSFSSLTEDMHIKILSIDQDPIYHLINELSPKELKKVDHPELNKLVESMATLMYNRKLRQEVVEHNFNQASHYLSSNSPIIVGNIYNIFECIYRNSRKIKPHLVVPM